MIMLKTIDPSEYVYLIKIVAHKFRSKVEIIQDSDPYSIASIELLKAVETYDPKINEDFSRYAYKLMCNGVRNSLRYNKRQKRTAIFKDLSYSDWLGLPEKEHKDVLPENLLDKLTVGLNAIDKKMLMDVFIHNKKIVDLAKEFKVSRIAVYDRLRKITKQIRETNSDLIDSFD